MSRDRGPCRQRWGVASVCSRTSIPVPSAAAAKSWWSRSFAPQKRTESAERIMDVQSSIIFPSALQSAP